MPPVAATCRLVTAVPTVPACWLGWPTARAGTAQVNVVDADLPKASVTVTVTFFAVPTVVGVPEIVPMLWSIDSPGGSPVAPHSPGAATDQVSGPVPPASDNGSDTAVPPVLVWGPGLVSVGSALTVQVKPVLPTSLNPSVALTVAG